jgi:hypothetical protein
MLALIFLVLSFNSLKGLRMAVESNEEVLTVLGDCGAAILGEAGGAAPLG